MSAPATQFKCVKCGDQPGSLEGLRGHITVEHLRWIPFECLFCEVFKATEMQLREHVQAKHPGKPFRLVLVSDPTNQQRLQLLIDQSTRPTIHNDQSASSTRSPAAIEIESDQECFSAAVNVSDAKLTSLSGSNLAASPAAFQRPSLNRQSAASTMQKPQAQQTIVEASDLCVKPEILDSSIATSNVQTRTSLPEAMPAVQAPMRLRAPKRQKAAVLRSETKRACRKRSQNAKVQSKFDYTGTDTSYCRLCRAKRSHASPIEHIYYTHIGENAIVCKFCSFTTRYNTNDMTKHLQKNHQSMAVGVGYEDRRKEFEPRVQELIRRCFGKEAYEESDLESSRSQLQDVDGANALLKDQAAETNEALTPERSMEADAVATDGDDNPEAVSPKPKTGLVTATAGACTECGKEVASRHRRDHIFASHLKANPIHCNYCDYSAKRRDLVKSHLSKYHASKDPASGTDDRSGQFEVQYSEWKARCFPKDEQPASDSKATRLMGRAAAQKQTKAAFCQLCQQAVLERKQTHVDRVHMQPPMIGCNFCDYTRSHNLSHMKRHLANRHPNESLSGYVDRRLEFLPERQATRQKCFGEKAAAESTEATDKRLC